MKRVNKYNHRYISLLSKQFILSVKRLSRNTINLYNPITLFQQGSLDK